MLTSTIHSRVLLHAINLRHGTDGFTSPLKEGMLRNFLPLKIRRLWPGLNPQTWVLKASTLPLDHRSHCTCPHSANQTTAILRSFKWEVLQHPPYSQDLAQSDFHLFGPLKQHLSGEHFPGDDAVERAACAWFWQQPHEFYAAGFQGLVKWWDKCLNLYGDNIEK